ncbi:MAG: Gfo/Idh/MocA family protein [Nitrososphaeria archaeon]|jgi:predicted dehydrogenase
MKVAVVGVGRWGENHVRVLSRMRRLSGIYDADRNRALVIAQKYGTFAYNSLDELRPDSVDAVVVATPATTHYDVARIFIEKGVNVLLEKPPSTNFESVKKLYELSKDKVKVGVGFIERFNPAFAGLEECYRRSSSAFFYRLATGSNVNDVGVVLDLMIHDINLADHLFGTARILFKNVIREKGRDVTAEALLDYGSSRAYLISSWKSTGRFRKIVAFGETALTEADLAEKKGSCTEIDHSIKSVEGKDKDLLEAEHLQFEKFINSGEPFPDISEAVKDMAVVEEVLS